MNSISIEQNKSKLLQLQFAARVLYNRAEYLNYVVWIICISNLLLGNITFPINDNYILFMKFLFAILPIPIQLLTKKNISNAALMRQVFDQELFHFNNSIPKENMENLLQILAKTVYSKKKIMSQQIKNTGSDKPPGVKDWYVSVNPVIDRKNAILYCQQQNRTWDKTLCKYYMTTISALLVIALFVVLFIFQDQILKELIKFILVCAPLIAKLIWEWYYYSNYRKVSNKIDGLIEAVTDNIEDKYLLSIQQQINIRREMPFIVPHFFHKISSKKLHILVKKKEEINK